MFKRHTTSVVVVKKYCLVMSHLTNILCSIIIVRLCESSLFYKYSKRTFFEDYYVTSTNLPMLQNISSIYDKSFITCELEFERNIFYKLDFQLKHTELVDSKTKFYNFKDNRTDDLTPFNEKYIFKVNGFVLSKPNSSVNGYLKDFFFYGTVFVDNFIYYIEDVRNYPKMDNNFKNAVIFKLLDKSTGQNQHEKYQSANSRTTRHITKDQRESFRTFIGNGKICSLFILLDNSFLTKIHEGNLKAAVTQVLSSLEETNALFRSTDFDGDGYPDNIGFVIKYIIAIQSKDSPMNLLPNYSSEIEGATYLETFSKYTLLNEVCLGIAFTGHTFKRGVVGVSYTSKPAQKSYYKHFVGGICDRPSKFQQQKNFNTIAVSPKLQSGEVIPQHIFDLCVAHEIGHSFGSGHDTTPECAGHLMAPHSPQDSDRKRFVFSSCSKDIILKTIISKGHCFQNNDVPFCGNGIVEAGEMCDCGTIRDCKSLDDCCIPRGKKNSCKIKRYLGIDCHPSQGICCTANCIYKDLSKFDLDCHNFEEKCPCRGSACECGVEGHCKGNVCSSVECTRLFLTECSCPQNNVSDKCETCCLFNNSCIPSHVATKKLLHNNSSLIQILKLFQNGNTKKSGKYRYNINYCYHTRCVELYFRGSKPSEYCLLHGEVGICSEHFECKVPRARRIFGKLSHSSPSTQSPSPTTENDNNSDNVSTLIVPLILLVALAFFVIFL